MEKEPREIKDLLRRRAREKRDGLSFRQRVQCSNQICGHLLEWEIFQDAGTLCFYYPLGSEADLLPAAKEALSQGKRVCFPRTAGDGMDFYRVRGLEEFQEGAFRVMEPTGQERMEEESPLILIPGLAFDRAGGRIGYGKAYYDRYFTRFPKAIRAGVCFETQLLEQIPAESHDISMHYIVTERGVI